MSLQQDMVSYRARHNMSQSEFAKTVKVSLQTINSVENGHQSPSKLTEAKIRSVIDAEKEKE